MEIDNSVKITLIHVVAAVITGCITALISLGKILGTSNAFSSTIANSSVVPTMAEKITAIASMPESNALIGGFIGIVILYAMGKLCDKLFGKQEGFSKWLWDGIVPFAFAWFVVWTLLLNYGPVIF